MLIHTNRGPEHRSTLTEARAEDMNGVLLSARRRRNFSQPHEQILGKSADYANGTGYPLVRHLLDVSVLAEAFFVHALSPHQKAFIADGLGVTEEQARDLVAYLAGIHDIGKASPHWQSKVLNTNVATSDIAKPVDAAVSDHFHEYASAQYVAEKYAHVDRPVRENLAAVLMGHHGVFPERRFCQYPSDPYDTLYRSSRAALLWHNDQKAIDADILAALGMTDPVFALRQMTPEVSVLITGIIIVTDWIASTEAFLDTHRRDIEGDTYAQQVSRLRERAPAILEEHGHTPVRWAPASWDALYDFSPNEMQKSLLGHASACTPQELGGLYLLSAPMGEGKTAAALALAHSIVERTERKGIWVTLPTQATADSLFYEAVVPVANRMTADERMLVSLRHGGTLPQEQADKLWSIEQQEPGTAPLTNGSLAKMRQSGFAHVAVSTLDQILRVGVALKHNMMWWLALSGKVLIIDEIHDYDEYTERLIGSLLAWCRALDVPVILMSATLDAARQERYASAYLGSASGPVNLGLVDWVHFRNGMMHRSQNLPQPDYTKVAFQTSYHKVPSGSLATSMSAAALRYAAQGASVLVSQHTVKDAVKMFEMLKRTSAVPVLLLHSRLSKRRKREVLEQLLSKHVGKQERSERQQVILVATQVVQQSMDVDFDVLLTPVCPVPDLFQRAGRVHRHARTNRTPAFHLRPVIGIFDSGDRDVYQEFDKKGTRNLISQYGFDSTPSTWHPSQKIMRDLDALARFQEAGALSDPVYGKWRKERDDLARRGEKAAVVTPGAHPHKVLQGLTRPVTSQHWSADATRIVQDSHLVVPVRFLGGALVYADGHAPVFDSAGKPRIKKLADEQINIPKVQYWNVETASAKVPSDEVPPFVSLIDVDAMGENIAYAPEYGMFYEKAEDDVDY